MARDLYYEADKINAMVIKIAIERLEIEDVGYDYADKKAEEQDKLDKSKKP